MIIDIGRYVGNFTSIAIDSNDNVHISHSITGPYLEYTTNASGSWVIHTIDNYGAYSSIAVDSNDNVHISYGDWFNHVLKYTTGEIPVGFDSCPNDPDKTDPGICGCGVSDIDTDGDAWADCIDGCPNDSNKASPGVCGCGIVDIDSDNDGTLNCNDGCPYDPNKIQPGVCGCNIADIDTDADGAPDCNDGCPNDASKTDPGVCGCGVADTDADADGFMICAGDCDDTRGDIHPDATDPSLIGKANFGFVSKYKKGATVPTGETEFQFKVANLNFHSGSYEWLVVASVLSLTDLYI